MRLKLTSSIQFCYSSCLTGRRSNVPVVDVPPPIEGGSGSGLAAREQLTTELTFPQPEESGQLYAYRLNGSAAVLRTREWRPFGTSQIAAIGLQEAGNGMYICVAENANEISSQTVIIGVSGMQVNIIK